MTSSGMYGRHDRRMLNFELARIIHADREREIEAEVRSRRLLATVRSKPAGDAQQQRPTIRSGQTPASSGALSR
jgi:hypothetical protein